MPWDDSQKAAFLRMQFAAQHPYYQEHSPHAAFDVIEHQLGGFDAYVEQTLSIDSAVRDSVRAKLLA